jgi:uncharacterized protein (DUF2132 family)
MNDEINYKNNPLHGVGLKSLLTQLVDQYGFEILYAYLNINCFKSNPSIESSVKFLKNTDWAREKVEAFYLYQFKSLPRASAAQFELPPRDRIVPADQTPREPTELSLEDAERLREKRDRKTAERDQRAGHRNPARGQGKSSAPTSSSPYARSSARSSANSSANSLANSSTSSSTRSSTRSPAENSRENASKTADVERQSDPWGKWKK